MVYRGISKRMRLFRLTEQPRSRTEALKIQKHRPGRQVDWSRVK